jgi:hypothetical protein
MYVTVVRNRGSPPAILLRETYREEGKVEEHRCAPGGGTQARQAAALRAILRRRRKLEPRRAHHRPG